MNFSAIKPQSFEIQHSAFVFVFGSNLQGIHGKGAALDAHMYFGTPKGFGSGFYQHTNQLMSYAFPTKAFIHGQLQTLSLPEIQRHAENFCQFATKNPHLIFELTAVGSGLAGIDPKTMLSFFDKAPKNVHLPASWLDMKLQATKGIKLYRVALVGSRFLPIKTNPTLAEALYQDFKTQTMAYLDTLYQQHQQTYPQLTPTLTIVSGGAAGADSFAARLADEQKFHKYIIHADWNAQKNKSGFVRNSALVWASNHVVAYWDGQSNGTMDTVKKAQREQLPVCILQPPPTLKEQLNTAQSNRTQTMQKPKI